MWGEKSQKCTLVLKPNKQYLKSFYLKVCASCEVLGHLCSEYHNVCRAYTQHGTVTLRTWQQLLQDVHFVAHST